LNSTLLKANAGHKPRTLRRDNRSKQTKTPVFTGVFFYTSTITSDILQPQKPAMIAFGTITIQTNLTNYGYTTTINAAMWVHHPLAPSQEGEYKKISRGHPAPRQHWHAALAPFSYEKVENKLSKSTL
jgi:hypothetical protein